MRIRAALVAIVAFACFVGLGISVGRHGEPAALLSWESALVDRSTLVAWWLTWDVYTQLLFPLAFALLVVAWRVPSWRTRILFSIAMLLLCWRGADLFQQIFARPRRLDWVVKHETSFSYPSSHAAIATGFYGLWALILALSELPRSARAIGAFLLIVLAFATCWSRLALGAHYLTDLVGGALFAGALVAAGLAVVPSALTFPVAGRLSRAAE
ncbi:MAG: phosphatase PAP2 family protein [Candidatus Eremiobacteraeota bacterium]|nr:phosphatase PAP2 family protein [Candidatus Eremiobacteraeota bacterium]